MATVTINGTELKTDDPKAVRKALAKALRDEKAKQDRDRKDRDLALMMARAEAYRVLERKLTDGAMPDAWILYRPGDKWATLVKARTTFTLGHYGMNFLGAVCDGSGYAMLIFLEDDTTKEVKCYAVAAVNDVHAMADLHCVTLADFARETVVASEDAA